MRPALFAAIVSVCAASAALRAEPPSLVAIQNARIVTVSGAVLEKGTVVVKDGLIADVGPSVAPPAGAWVIDGNGLTVYPGLIDAMSTWGIPPAPSAPTGAAATRGSAPTTPGAPNAAPPRANGPEDRPLTTSWVHAADLVQPSDSRLDAARNAGFTTAVTFPREGIIAGHGAVIDLSKSTPGQMVVAPNVGLYLTLRTAGFNSFPGSLMGTFAYLRQTWSDAAWYKDAQAIYAKNPTTLQRPAYDRALEGVLEAQRVLLPADSRVQIERVAHFAAELKTPAILYGAHEGYRSVEALKKAGYPVILDVNWPAKAKNGDPEQQDGLRLLELRDKAPSTPGALAKAQIKFAFTSDGLSAPKEIIPAIKKAILAGLSEDDAVRALTLNAAEIYGVSNRLGSIEKGKIANLTVVKGKLFDDSAKVQMVFIDGVKYDPVPEAQEAPGGGRRPGPAVETSTDDEEDLR